MKEKRFSFFADTQEIKAENQRTFGFLPTYKTNQKKPKELNFAITQKKINFEDYQNNRINYK